MSEGFTEGTVARWVGGYGFIQPDASGPQIFVHWRGLVGCRELHEGERVKFLTRDSPGEP